MQRALTNQPSRTLCRAPLASNVIRQYSQIDMEGKNKKTILIVLVSGIGGIVLFILAIYLYAYLNYTDVDNQIVFYDKEHEKRFIEALDKSGVHYKKGLDDSIWYSNKDKGKIEEIENVLAKTRPAEFGIYERTDLKKVLKKLDAEKIPYKVIETKNENKIIVENKYREKARILVREVLLGE